MFRDDIARINGRLKAALISVRIRLNGNRLVLRATLPKKPGEGEGTKQYDLSLGIPASKDGLRRIEAEAQKLGGLLALGRFSWDLYMKPKSEESQEKTVAQLAQAFKDEYLRSHKIEELTWRETWQRTFDRLPQGEPLSEASILVVVLATENHTRNRELTCQRLQRLAGFAGLEMNLRSYQGEYNERTTKPRDIPADELIVQWRDCLPNPAWQWVYGIIAAFGLRPHEAFFCEFIDSHSLEVFKGKTGYRIARAIHPNWVEQWKLTEVNRPNLKCRSYRDYGQRCRRQFLRYSVPFCPYDLRHAYAIRGSVVKGLPISTMASMMGHSVPVHTQIYHRWLSDSTNQEVYRKLILGEV